MQTKNETSAKLIKEILDFLPTSAREAFIQNNKNTFFNNQLLVLQKLLEKKLIKQIVSNTHVTFILNHDGELYGCGLVSRLGRNLTELEKKEVVNLKDDRLTIPCLNKFILITDDVKEVILGQGHSLIIKNDNSLWSCGRNDKGQLGSQSGDESVTEFSRIADDVIFAVAGVMHTLFIKSDHTLWGCGNNNKGQLGEAIEPNKYNSPSFITENVKHIVTEDYATTFIIKLDNSLWASGDNGQGQLGLGKQDNVRRFHCVTDNVAEIKTFGLRSLILKKDATLWVTGLNLQGQLGLGHTNNVLSPQKVMNNIKQVAINDGGSSWALTHGGVLYGTQNNKFVEIAKDVQSIPGNNFVLKNDNTLWLRDNSTLSQQIRDVRTITLGSDSIFIVKNDGSVVVSGYNAYGILGIGSNGITPFSYDEIRYYKKLANLLSLLKQDIKAQNSHNDEPMAIEENKFETKNIY